jgi:hypothetical protein
MLAVSFGAFAWVDAWWATALLLVMALAIGWYSLGLFARASQGAAWRAMRGIATAEDMDELEHLGDRARGESFKRAASTPDPQRDRIFSDLVAQFGGRNGARGLVVEHLALHGVEIGEPEADRLLDEWRLFGIVRDQSLGEYLDEIAHDGESLRPGRSG